MIEAIKAVRKISIERHSIGRPSRWRKHRARTAPIEFSLQFDTAGAQHVPQALRFASDLKAAAPPKA
jgi:hypothetical protein